MDSKIGITAELSGIPFSSKEELISLIMDACSCQQDIASETMNRMLIESFDEGYVSWDFVCKYWSRNEYDGRGENI
jgi:hypothetical protein